MVDNNSCHNLLINTNGTLRNLSGWYYTLNVTADVINNGTISNSSYELTINIDGNITNNGLWNNTHTYLSGTSTHHLLCENNNSFSGVDFVNTGSGDAILDGDIYFNNIGVNMNNHTLNIPANTTLKLHQGYLLQCMIIGVGSSSIVYGEGVYGVDVPYFQSTSFTDLTFDGNISIGNACQTYGLITNNNELTNKSGWYQALTVWGDLVNNGSIQNTSYTFTLNIYGNFTNNGICSNSIVDFYGTDDQYILEQSSHTFTMANFRSFKPSGKIIALSDIDFANCIINMQEDTLILQNNGELKITSGQLLNTVLNAEDAKSGTLDLEMDNNSFISNCEVYQPTIKGKVRLYGNQNVFYGNTVIADTLDNYGWYYELNVYGELINNGVIMNSSYSLDLKLHENFVNNGSCNISSIDFYGDEDQYLSELNNNTFTPQNFRSYKPSGKIIALTDIDFANCIINMQEDTLILQNNGKLKVASGQLINTVLLGKNAKNGNLDLEMDNNSFISNCEIYQPTIKGKVRIYGNDNMFYGNTVITDTLDNYGWYYELNVYGELINNGVIMNSSYSLDLKLHENFVNNGSCNISSIDFYGDEDQYFSELNNNTFTPQNFKSYKPSGKIIALTDIDFANCIINMQEDTLILQNNGKLKVASSQLINTVLLGKNAKNGNLNLEMDKNSFISNCEIYQPTIMGKVRINGNDNVFYGNTVITDTLDNYGWYYELNIHGNILNQGLIQDESYSLHLKVDGDIINDGFWQNDYTYCTGTTDQHITCLNSNSFNGYQFESNNTNDVYLDDFNYFDNVRIDFHDNNLILSEEDTLQIHNGYLYRCKVYGDTTSVLYGEGSYGVDAPYFQNIELNNITLAGTIPCNGNDCSTNGLLTNNGILMNTNWYYTLNIHGDVINNQTVRNSGYEFTINVDGDIINNGSWMNTTTSLTGSTDQTVTIQNGHIIQCHLSFVSDLSSSPYQWIWNANPISTTTPFFSGATSTTLQLNASLNNYYTGTYYCSTGAGNSRNIIVNDSSHRMLVNVVLEGAYNGSDMNTKLHSTGFIPLSQPYHTAPWNYVGTETVSGLPSANVVDWVLVEFYDAVDAAVASAGTPFARRACFLKKNAEIVDVDGGNLISFSGNISNNLFIKVIHRNHVAVLSANPVSFSSYYYYYSFNTATGQAYESNQKWMSSNAVMIGGDANGDANTNTTDKLLWNAEAGSKGYKKADFNMDGQVNNLDKNEILLENLN